MENNKFIYDSDAYENITEFESEDENEILRYDLFKSLQKQQNLESKVIQLTKEFKDFKKQVNEINFKEKFEETESETSKSCDEMIKSHFNNEILMLKKNFDDQLFYLNKKICDFTNSNDIAFIKTAKFEHSQIKQNEENNATILLDLKKKISENESEINVQRIKSKTLQNSIVCLVNQDINTEITINGLREGKLLLDHKVQKLEGQVAALEKDMKKANKKIQSNEKRVAKLERKVFMSAFASCVPFYGSIIHAVMDAKDALQDVMN